MKTTQSGQTAETAAVRYLRGRGYQIVDRNWRTRTCEIDIVAYKDRTIYFIEVKYRRSNRQGTGFDYITPVKQRQMAYAAGVWVARYGWRGMYALSAACVSGPDYVVESIRQI